MEPDETLVRRLLAAQAPHWADLPLRQVRPGGWDNRTFRLGTDMAVRLPSAARYAPQAGKEHRWLPHLAPGLPLPIPRSIALGRPDDLFPWPWSVRSWLAGDPLSQAGVRDLVALARSLGGFLVALRRIDARDGPRAGAHSFHRGASPAVYGEETEAAIGRLAGGIDAARAGAIWARACATGWRGDPVWVHGDVAPGNLLVRDGALAGVIDFGCLAVGDPACDAAIAWTAFEGESRRAFRAAVAFDDDSWRRAAGWALWKALIVAAGRDATPDKAGAARGVLDALLQDDFL